MHLRGMGVRGLFAKPDLQVGGASEGVGLAVFLGQRHGSVFNARSRAWYAAVGLLRGA